MIEAQRRNVAAFAPFDAGDARLAVDDAACDGKIAKIGAEQPGIEVIAIFDPEREIARRHRREPPCRQDAVEQDVVGPDRHVVAEAAIAAIENERILGMHVDLGGEGVAIAGPGGRRAPPVEPDPRLVRRAAARHPFGLFGADQFEEALQGRGRTLADADRADFGRFDQRHAAVGEGAFQEVCGDPARGTAARDDEPAGRDHAAAPPNAFSHWSCAGMFGTGSRFIAAS